MKTLNILLCFSFFFVLTFCQNNSTNDTGVDVEKLFNVKEYISYYISSRSLTNRETLNDDEFTQLFIYVLQRGALKVEVDTKKLKALAKKMLDKHGRPAKVVDLNKYFDIMELTLTYSKMGNTDL